MLQSNSTIQLQPSMSSPGGKGARGTGFNQCLSLPVAQSTFISSFKYIPCQHTYTQAAIFLRARTRSCASTRADPRHQPQLGETQERRAFRLALEVAPRWLEVLTVHTLSVCMFARVHVLCVCLFLSR